MRDVESLGKQAGLGEAEVVIQALRGGGVAGTIFSPPSKNCSGSAPLSG